MSATSLNRELRVAQLLAWYRELGVDAAVQPEAIDWRLRAGSAPGAGFSLASQAVRVEDQTAAREPRKEPMAATSVKARPPSQASGDPARAFSSLPPDAAVDAARTSAASARSIDELAAGLSRFDGCGLKATAKTLCFYRGARQARLLIVGEAPGREEDIEGRPFVGPAGQLLDKMLAAIGLGESDVHITNIVYWRPPGNRPPTPAEAQSCRPFLERQAELVGAEFLLALGGAAAKHLFDVAEGILRIRGKWRDTELGSQRMRAMATLHPAYLLRQPSSKGLAWRDLLALKSAMLGKRD